VATSSPAHRIAHRILVRKLKLVPPSAAARPYAVPGWARIAELRWRWKLRRTPVESGDDYAARSKVGEIEEMVPCALCGDRRVQHLFSPTRPGRWTYHVVRCASCGFLYRNPGVKPERLGDLYTKGNYGKFLTGRYGKKRQRNYRGIMKEFAPVFDDGAGRRLLDYGSGAGLYMELAHERGFDTYGIDLSPDSVAIARERPGGAQSFVGVPPDVPEIAAGGFDLVTMWSVLAHLPRPVGDIRMLRGLLADDGMLMISTVNANSLTLKAHGLKWGGFTPNHLVFFSPDTMPSLLRQAGFAAVVFRPMYAIPPRFTPGQERRLRRSVDRGNQGRMLRALAFASADGPARWGMAADAVSLR
jgi:SAM-dependent methyltransferase